MRYKNILFCTLAVVFQLLTFACKDDMAEGITQGVVIKSYMPSAVMSGMQMSITGTNLQQAGKIIFPGDVEVSDFKVVTSNLIKVNVPSGISPEGGVLKIVTDSGIIEGHIKLRLARPALTGIEPGDEVSELQEMTFKGEDLECIGKVIFPGADDEDIEMPAMNFQRKSSGNIKVLVPVGIRTGMNKVKLVAFDGSVLESQEVNMLAVAAEPDGSAVLTLQSVSAERYLTRDPARDVPVIKDYSGRADQQFNFMPVPGTADEFFIQSKSSGEFLVVGDEYDWRMAWVADPVNISDPVKGRFKIESLGQPGLVQIRAMASVVFGLDSNDDGSEVYSNKSGTDNPMYQWRMEILSGSLERPAPSFMIWEGEQDFGEWYDFYLEADQFGDLTVGAVIKITITASDAGWSNFDLSDIDWQDFSGFAWKHPQDEWPDGIVKLTVDQDVYDRIMRGGLRIRGAYFTLYKVEITPGEPAPEPSDLLWEGEQAFGDWFIVRIEAGLLGNLAEGDTIRIHYTPEEGQFAQLDLRDSRDVSFPGMEWLDMVGNWPDGYVDFVVDADAVSRLTSGGLLIRGSHYTLTKVEIIKALSDIYWEGEQSFGDWFIVTLESSLFGNLNEGDAIRIHYIPEEGQFAQLDLRDSNDAGFENMEWVDMRGKWPDGHVDFIVDSDAVKRIQKGGLLVRGSHYTLTKVERINSSDL